MQVAVNKICYIFTKYEDNLRTCRDASPPVLDVELLDNLFTGSNSVYVSWAPRCCRILLPASFNKRFELQQIQP